MVGVSIVLNECMSTMSTVYLQCKLRHERGLVDKYVFICRFEAVVPGRFAKNIFMCRIISF